MSAEYDMVDHIKSILKENDNDPVLVVPSKRIGTIFRWRRIKRGSTFEIDVSWVMEDGSEKLIKFLIYDPRSLKRLLRIPSYIKFSNRDPTVLYRTKFYKEFRKYINPEQMGEVVKKVENFLITGRPKEMRFQYPAPKQYEAHYHIKRSDFLFP